MMEYKIPNHRQSPYKASKSCKISRKLIRRTQAFYMEIWKFEVEKGLTPSKLIESKFKTTRIFSKQENCKVSNKSGCNI